MSRARIFAVCVAAMCLLWLMPWNRLAPSDTAPWKEADPKLLPPTKAPHGGPVTFKDVAGTYRHTWGPGGAHITIDSSGGWNYSASGCFGDGVYSRGDASIEDGRLLFEVSRPFFAPRGKRCSGVPVWYGDTVFLLSQDKVLYFLNMVNWGGPEGLGEGTRWFFVREGSGSARALSMPDSMRACVLARPLHGKLGKYKPGSGTEIGFGRSDGAFVGMRILSEKEEGETRYFDVTAVTENSCFVRFHGSDRPADCHEGLRVWCDARGADLLK